MTYVVIDPIGSLKKIFEKIIHWVDPEVNNVYQ